MTEAISAGRWLGLKRTSTASDVFTILAFDQRGTYRKMLPASTTYEEAVAIKREVVVALSKTASAVLLDTDYGLESALSMDRRSGLLMSYEKSGYSGDSTYRHIEFEPDWTVAKIKRMGATAVKLMAYYHPDTGALAEEIEGVIKQVADDCHAHDIPLYLEPMSYSLQSDVTKESETFAQTRPEVILKTAQRLSPLGADVLKLEFPYDANYNTDHAEWQRACEAISQASVIPWVLLSAGVDFNTFADQTRIACAAGASGFLAGRAIWKEAVTMPAVQRAEFLSGTASTRLQELSEIANKNARPWTEFFAPMPAPKGWEKTY
jgi:tagatose 1,6-diphosphate aldolase